MNYLIEFDYVSEETDELSLTKGDVVTEVRESEDGWMEGVLRGRKGVFPSNFGKPIRKENNNIGDQSDGGISLSNEVEEKKPQYIVTEEQKPQNKKVMGVGFGNIFSGKPIQLKHTIMNESKFQMEEDNQKTEVNVDKRMRSGSVGKVEFVKATYAYKAENPDELQIEEGDIIAIIDKKNTDEGWWKGKHNNGKVGIFPNNFVEPYILEEVPKPSRPLLIKKNPPPAPLTAKPKPKLVPSRPPNPDPINVVARNASIKNVQEEPEEINLDTPVTHRPLVGPTAERVRRQNIRLPKNINTGNNNSEESTAIISSQKSFDAEQLESSVTKSSAVKKSMTLPREMSDESTFPESKSTTYKTATIKEKFSEILPTETSSKLLSSRDRNKDAIKSDVIVTPKGIQEKSKEHLVISGNYETVSVMKTNSRPKSQFCSNSVLKDVADSDDSKKKLISLEIRINTDEENNASLRKEFADFLKTSTAQFNDLTSTVNELLRQLEKEKEKRTDLENQVQDLKARVYDLE